MRYHARSSTFIFLLISIETLSAMEQDSSSSSDEETPLSSHLKNFKKGKTGKKVVERRPITPDEHQEEPNTLAQHVHNFREGKTCKQVIQREHEEPPEPPLALHQRQFFYTSARQRHFVEYERAPVLKTLAQRIMELQALRIAVSINDTHEVRRLLAQDINPHGTNNRTQETTLHIASRLGHNEVLALLLEQPGINIEITDRDQRPALADAICYSRPVCVGALLERRAWVGADANNHTVFHLAAETADVFTIAALLIYCIHPLIPILEPPAPPNNNNANNNNNVNNDNNNVNNDNNPANQNADEDPFEVLQRIIDQLGGIPDRESSEFPTLRSYCIRALLDAHLKAHKAARCDILGPLWGGRLSTCFVTSEMLEEFSPHLSFANARMFIESFSPSDHRKIALALAHWYAQEHITNVNRLLRTITNSGHTPLQLAVLHNKSPHIQGLVDPMRYVAHLNIMLKPIAALRPYLSDNPDEQDAFVLFYVLFVYRLLGGNIIFKNT